MKQFVEVSSYDGISGSNARTVEAWIKVPTSAGNVPIISWGENQPSSKWTVRLDGKGLLRVAVGNGWVVGSTNLLDGKWHHVAVAWEMVNGVNNIENAKLYVDGKLEKVSDKQAVTLNTRSSAVRIGSDLQGGYFQGEMNEVRIWSEARTQKQIEANRNVKLNGKETNLEAYYNFDNGTANDFSSKGRNGILKNGASIISAPADLPTFASAIPVLGQTITGLENSQAGTSISGGEDINGDGLADFAVGAPAVDNLSYALFGGDFTIALNQGGTLGNDVLQGTATGDAMIGNSGTDFLLGNGGIDALSGGSGNDVLTIKDDNFRRVDGGSGFDVVKLEGELNQTWNVTELAQGGRLRNLEVIDITGYGNNTLILNSTTVLNLSATSNTVFVDADGGTNLETDILYIGDDFKANGKISSHGVAYDEYTAEEATLYVTPGATVNLHSAPSLPIEPSEEIADNTPQLTSNANSSETTVDAFDPTPRIFVSETIVSEAEREAHFTVVRTGDLSQGLTLNYTTYDGTANAGVDFTPYSGKITFAPNVNQARATIPLTDEEISRQAYRYFDLRITENFTFGGDFTQTVEGSNGEDILLGSNIDGATVDNTSGRYRFDGKQGDDLIYGSAERDILKGGADKDFLFGKEGVDKLYGELGDDLLDGGKDRDFLYGGEGADGFVLRQGDGTDRVMDFNSEEGDLFLLDQMSFGTLSFESNKILVGEEILAIVLDNAGNPITDLNTHPEWFTSL
ncbi:LamG-like jellyroll fold domain-containing protein [Crocosphaera sp. Alani8]|uniref:LamG-like jellyroll fold domain-containing protein n=1 Tax=Crocosphaera sp. Alani8 TaxID=3038952 RepID=UPI00313DF309